MKLDLEPGYFLGAHLGGDENGLAIIKVIDPGQLDSALCVGDLVAVKEAETRNIYFYSSVVGRYSEEGPSET